MFGSNSQIGTSAYVLICEREETEAFLKESYLLELFVICGLLFCFEVGVF